MKSFQEFLEMMSMPTQDFKTFLSQFTQAPYYIEPNLLQAILTNPKDVNAFNAISSRNFYVGQMIQKFIQSGGRDTTHKEPEWDW